jgi:hypothetical protein
VDGLIGKKKQITRTSRFSLRCIAGVIGKKQQAP